MPDARPVRPSKGEPRRRGGVSRRRAPPRPGRRVGPKRCRGRPGGGLRGPTDRGAATWATPAGRMANGSGRDARLCALAGRDPAGASVSVRSALERLAGRWPTCTTAGPARAWIGRRTLWVPGELRSRLEPGGRRCLPRIAHYWVWKEPLRVGNSVPGPLCGGRRGRAECSLRRGCRRSPRPSRCTTGAKPGTARDPRGCRRLPGARLRRPTPGRRPQHAPGRMGS